jgi:DNA-binding transcriptional MerR regulator
LSKSPEAFRTISEVSAELDVPKHVLRFWETKFAHVKPMKRGGNRRYYRPEDVELLRGIRTLLHDEGYTIRGLQRVMRQQGVNYVKTCWRNDASGDGTQTHSALPDLAGEAAGHARKQALERAKDKPKRGKRAASAGAQAASGANNQTFNTAQRAELEAALSELQQCRQLLASAQAPAS